MAAATGGDVLQPHKRRNPAIAAIVALVVDGGKDVGAAINIVKKNPQYKDATGVSAPNIYREVRKSRKI
eukprot:COSAG05_NODE_194_length_14555_cov_25.382955_5_plen_69_part_00